MKRKRIRILSLMTLMLTTILVGCSSSIPNDTVQTQLESKAAMIENYHLTLQQTEKKVGDSTITTQVIANSSVWNDGRGFGTRIDKTDGKATNEVEVIADTNGGAIKYYQDQWQSTLTAQSSLESVVGFPYSNVLSFLNEISTLAQWQSNGSLTYKGQDALARQSLSKLGITVSESVQIVLSVQLNADKNVVESFTLKTSESDGTIVRDYQVTYSGFNTQKMRQLPEIPLQRKSGVS